MTIHVGHNIVRVIKWEHSPNAALLGRVFRVMISNMFGQQYTFQYLVPFSKTPHYLIFDLHYFFSNKHWCSMELDEKNGMLAIRSIEEITDKSQDRLNYEAGVARGTPEEFLVKV